MEHNFTIFRRQYPVKKTITLGLLPVGTTRDHFYENILGKDVHRAESYVKMKKLIDEYHKAYIDRVLKVACLKCEGDGHGDSLLEFLDAYNNRSEKLKDIQAELRKQIAKQLASDTMYKCLFAKELICAKGKQESELARFINDATEKQLDSMSKEEAMNLLNEFDGFTTYFTGFHENRKNMYTDEEKSTGIAYRLINENLPRFVDNMRTFSEIVQIPKIREATKLIFADFAADLNGKDIDEMFQLKYYGKLLTQRQIETYNAVIGGRTDNGHTEKIKGLNEYINRYNQDHKDAKLPMLKLLFKQILSDKESLSWLPEKFESDQEVLNAINDCYNRLSENVLGNGVLRHLLGSLSGYDTDGIFVSNDLQLTNISKRMFGGWDVIQNAIKEDVKATAPARKRKESEEDYQKRIDGIYKKAESFSVKYIDDCLARYRDGDACTVEAYFATCGAVDTPSSQCENLFSQIANAYTDASSLLHTQISASRKLAQEDENIQKIKKLLDAIKGLQHFVKPLLGSGDESGKDERFYGELASLWSELDTVTPLYNMVRNYMTRKPYSQEQIKINFENAQLLDGWDRNKETANACVLLRCNGLYYLAVVAKNYRTALLGKEMPSGGDCYERMVYKLLPGANKMLPKVFFAKSNVDKFGPSKEIAEIYEKGTHKKGADFNIDDCHALIDYFKQCIDKHEDWSRFGFKFSDTSTYKDMNDFYEEVEQQAYKITFEKVSVSFIDKMVEEGKIYLFQIYNKDFSEYSKGTPNMHTLYWKALFDEQNLADVVYKLNGQAEIFFRKKSLECTHPTHPRNVPIRNKNKENEKKESVFKYDLIKDRRYTIDQFSFHVPVTLNFKAGGKDNIDQKVREYLKQADDTHVIGIDRGERNLLYIVVIDKYGNIVEQCSLNEIVNEYNGNTYRTDYHALLGEREAERLEARRSWKTIESIKELKEGYLSQVIHKISQLMVKYHAIVVLEDLNIGFMRGRQKVEKQVYQKFEKMLIDKLNYLVDKKADVMVPGGLYNAYQLTSEFKSFQKLGKQSGFLFYIPAWMTSKIDPVTGFVNLLDTRYQNTEKTKSFFAKFDSVRYNADQDWFELKMDYNNFGGMAEGTRTKWTLCTQGKRIETFRNYEKNSQWDSREVNLTDEFKALFSQYGINIMGNLKDAISCQSEKVFFQQLMRLLRLTLQMRNSKTGTDIDYLVSPVADENGDFFNSNTCDDSLPKDADANGAYNIARKGLMLIDQIKRADDVGKKFRFDIKNKSWLNFAQQKPYRE